MLIISLQKKNLHHLVKIISSCYLLSHFIFIIFFIYVDLIFLHKFSFSSSFCIINHSSTQKSISPSFLHILLSREIGKYSLGCAATPNLSQNMFFTGTTIPLTDVMHQNHQSVAMTQNRTPPTLFQYPSKFFVAF